MQRIEGEPFPDTWQDVTPEGRHLGLLYVTPEMFLSQLIGRGRHAYEVSENELPEDTQLVGVAVDERRGAIVLKLEHPSFPQGAPGQPIPELPAPLMRVWYGGGSRLGELLETAESMAPYFGDGKLLELINEVRMECAS